MTEMDTETNNDVPLPEGGGNLFGFFRTFFPLISIILSAISISTLKDVDIILTLILKFTSLATFVIYFVINYEAIKRQVNKWAKEEEAKKPSDEEKKP